MAQRDHWDSGGCSSVLRPASSGESPIGNLPRLGFGSLFQAGGGGQPPLKSHSNGFFIKTCFLYLCWCAYTLLYCFVSLRWASRAGSLYLDLETWNSDMTGGARFTMRSAASANQLSRPSFRYTGKERDAESGLDNFGARYMASTMGRFMSPDPFLNSGRPENPQTWNRYTYALNNPLTIPVQPSRVRRGSLYMWDKVSQTAS